MFLINNRCTVTKILLENNLFIYNFAIISIYSQYAGIKIGPVVKRDVMKASIMLEHKPEWVKEKTTSTQNIKVKLKIHSEARTFCI